MRACNKKSTDITPIEKCFMYSTKDIYCPVFIASLCLIKVKLWCYQPVSHTMSTELICSSIHTFWTSRTSNKSLQKTILTLVTNKTTLTLVTVRVPLMKKKTNQLPVLKLKSFRRYTVLYHTVVANSCTCINKQPLSLHTITIFRKHAKELLNECWKNNKSIIYNHNNCWPWWLLTICRGCISNFLNLIYVIVYLLCSSNTFYYALYVKVLGSQQKILTT